LRGREYEVVDLHGRTPARPSPTLRTRRKATPTCWRFFRARTMFQHCSAVANTLDPELRAALIQHCRHSFLERATPLQCPRAVQEETMRGKQQYWSGRI